MTRLRLAALALAPGLARRELPERRRRALPAAALARPPGSACMACATADRVVRQRPAALVRCSCAAAAATARDAIPWRYPLVELDDRAARRGVRRSPSGSRSDAAVAAFFCAALVAISATDLERRIIPNRIVLPAAASCSSRRRRSHPSPEWAIAGARRRGASSSLAALAYPGGMGMGDVKLALLLGVELGRTVPVALMVGMLAALVPSVVLFARHGAAARKMAIPFGPFLALGGVVALFAGERAPRRLPGACCNGAAAVDDRRRACPDAATSLRTPATSAGRRAAALAGALRARPSATELVARA